MLSQGMSGVLEPQCRSGGVAPIVNTIVNPIPENKHEILRIGRYYRKFCFNFSTITEPLNSLLQKWRKFVWTGESQNAFEKIKFLLLSAPVLKAPNFEKHFKFKVYTSDIGIYAVLLLRGHHMASII